MVAVILSAALFVWNHFKYKLAHQKIQQLVQKSNGLYNLYYDNLTIDEVGGILLARNIQLLPDTVLYHALLLQHKAPPVLVSINMSTLRITGVKTPRALLNKEIEGTKLEIDHPSIEIGIRNFLKDTSGYNPGKDICKQILSELKSIKVDTVIATDADLLVKDILSGKTLFHAEHVTLLLNQLAIDSAQAQDSTRILFSKNLDLLCREIVLGSKDNQYKYHFEGLEFISQLDQFKIRRIEIEPRLSEEAFANAYTFSKDRYHFIFENLRLSQIDLPLLWHKILKADSLSVGNSSFMIYRDISHPHDSLSRVGSYPQQQIKNAPIPFYIGKIIFGRSFIEYKEKNGKSDSSGKLQFGQVSARIINISNMPARIRKDHLCLVNFNAQFLHVAPLSTELQMDLNANAAGAFSIKGSMGPMDAKQLNALAVPMGLTRIEKGEIQKLNFFFQGNDYGAKGKLLILYKGIRLTLLKNDKKEKRYRAKPLPSLVANGILKKSNPTGSEPIREVDVNQARDIHKSFFSLLWKTIFKGVKETAGIGK
jgi:hypothetical protein